MRSERIEIVDYRPEWPAEFAALGARLRSALGELATRIDHIGSTSVPGLAAKDIIDVQVTVRRLDPAVIGPPVEAAGLIWLPDINRDHVPPGMSLAHHDVAKMYARAVAPQRRANVHFRRAGGFNQRYALLCRDYLRAHRLTASAYADVKRQLARHFPDDEDAYYDVKDPAFDLFMVAAEEWAGWTSWAPGPSDV